MNPSPFTSRNTPSTPAGRLGKRPVRSTLAAVTASLVLFTGCASTADVESVLAADSGSSQVEDTSAEAASDLTDVDLFDSGTLHTIDVDFDSGEYDAMIATFTETGEKDWISATVTLDGTTYEDVGLRLKGNSSLFGLTAETSDNPEDLPWLIRLNKFVDGEDHQDYEDIVIRSNSTETGMNEAVAQELLADVGLAAQSPIATAFTVNGGETELRLAVENPDAEWYEDNFTDVDGLLYKADSEGDYSYLGDDAEAYAEAWDQEVGDNDMEPLIGFLEFINNSDDETFAAELGGRLDVEAFATYLAFQDLIGNGDDIDGRGNNSYLQYDTTAEQFTVVSWDLNLAFGTANIGGGERPAGAPAEAEAGAVPGDAQGDEQVAGGGPDRAGGGDASNVLVERFMANADFAELYEAKTAELTEQLYGSGAAEELIATWSDLLTSDAGDLVAADTVSAEATALSTYIDG